MAAQAPSGPSAQPWGTAVVESLSSVLAVRQTPFQQVFTVASVALAASGGSTVRPIPRGVPIAVHSLPFVSPVVPQPARASAAKANVAMRVGEGMDL
ncbi:hypothetical protein GCM10009678_18810 [Actinomadura kijaniata]